MRGKVKYAGIVAGALAVFSLIGAVAYSAVLRGQGATATCGTFTECLSGTLGVGSGSGTGSGSGNTGGGSGGGSGSVFTVEDTNSTVDWVNIPVSTTFNTDLFFSREAYLDLNQYSRIISNNNIPYIYTAENTYISVVDLRSGTELRRISIPYNLAAFKVIDRQIVSGKVYDTVVYWGYRTGSTTSSLYVYGIVYDQNTNSATSSLIASSSVWAAPVSSYSATIFDVDGGKLNSAWAGCTLLYMPYIYQASSSFYAGCTAFLYCPSSSPSLQRLTVSCSLVGSSPLRYPAVAFGLYETPSGVYYVFADTSSNSQVTIKRGVLVSSATNRLDVTASVIASAPAYITSAQVVRPVASLDTTKLCFEASSPGKVEMQCFENFDPTTATFSSPVVRNYEVPLITFTIPPATPSIDPDGYCTYNVASNSVQQIRLYIGSLYNNGQCPSISRIEPFRRVGYISNLSEAFRITLVEFQEVTGQFYYLGKWKFSQNEVPPTGSGKYFVSLEGVGYLPRSSTIVDHHSVLWEPGTVINRWFKITDPGLQFSP